MRRLICSFLWSLPWPCGAAPLPADVQAYVRHQHTCAEIAVLRWGDDRPWAEQGCYDLATEENAIRRAYKTNKTVIEALRQDAGPPVHPPLPAIAPPAGSLEARGGVWSSALLDWHNGDGSHSPASVAVLHNEIVLTAPPNFSAQLTHDGVWKSHPVFSPDGARIAFLEPPDRRPGIGRIMVIDRHGNEPHELRIQPADPRIGQPPKSPREPGIAKYWHSIAEFLWVGNDRIAVESDVAEFGTHAFLLIDVNTGRTVTEFVDTGNSATFSPDGRHYAYRSDLQFASLCLCDPPYPKIQVTLSTDAGKWLVPPGETVDFRKMVWSADSRRLFIPVTTSQDAARVAVWEGGSATFLPGVIRDGIGELFERDGDLFATREYMMGPKPEWNAWRFPRGRFPPIRFVPKYNTWDPVELASSHREWLEKTVHEAWSAAADPDFWCRDCDLTLLPRSSAPTHPL